MYLDLDKILDSGKIRSNAPLDLNIEQFGFKASDLDKPIQLNQQILNLDDIAVIFIFKLIIFKINNSLTIIY